MVAAVRTRNFTAASFLAATPDQHADLLVAVNEVAKMGVRVIGQQLAWTVIGHLYAPAIHEKVRSLLEFPDGASRAGKASLDLRKEVEPFVAVVSRFGYAARSEPDRDRYSAEMFRRDVDTGARNLIVAKFAAQAVDYYTARLDGPDEVVVACRTLYRRFEGDLADRCEFEAVADEVRWLVRVQRADCCAKPSRKAGTYCNTCVELPPHRVEAATRATQQSLRNNGRAFGDTPHLGISAS